DFNLPPTRRRGEKGPGDASEEGKHRYPGAHPGAVGSKNSPTLALYQLSIVKHCSLIARACAVPIGPPKRKPGPALAPTPLLLNTLGLGIGRGARLLTGKGREVKRW